MYVLIIALGHQVDYDNGRALRENHFILQSLRSILLGRGSFLRIFFLLYFYIIFYHIFRLMYFSFFLIKV